MAKKLAGVCVVLVTCCAAFAPTASAANDPQLTDGGVLAEAGSGWKLTGPKFKIVDTSLNGLDECSNSSLEGIVTKNSSSTIEGEFASAAFSGTGAVSPHNSLNECTGSFGNAYLTIGLPLCIKSSPAMAEDEFQISGGGGCSGKVNFTIGSTTAGACKYETAAPVQGDYTTGGTEAELAVRSTSSGSGASKIEGGFLCPTSVMLAVRFKLERVNSNKLTIS
ncbi:MAG TPA: hypothetical protein VFN85_09770 [Solirubrobacterales bacterium]|nr:hypothetical protein [Solirubrobacterales bacterium]